MRLRYLVLALASMLLGSGCGEDSTAGAPGGSGGTTATGGTGGAGFQVGQSCGAPLSAPANYDTQEELEALMLGAWELCEGSGLFTPEAVGIELRQDRIWVELFELDGEVVRSREERQWLFYNELTLALVGDGGGMTLYRPKLYAEEGQMQIEHTGDNRRLRAIRLP
ncbi:MAG: hypothetical protein WBG86_09615 [Polyangiales bacterium]